MSDKPVREWRFYVDDMVSFSEKVLAYTYGMSKAEFIASGMTDDATVRNLELIGEAGTHVPETIRNQASHIPCV